MPPARGDRDDIRQRWREAALPVSVEAPGYDCAVSSQRNAVEITCRDGNNVRQVRGHIAISVAIRTPRYNRSVGF